jgi:ankyrin repeat protein
MAGEQIINKHTITHHMNNRGDDDESEIFERTDKALALINSSILNTLHQPSNNRSLLHICVENGWYRAVVQLLKRSVNVNIIDDEQYTPLMLALNLSKTDIFKILLANDDMDINYQRTIDGFTVLHLSIINDRDQYLKILFQQTKHQLNFNLTTNSKKNFLHLMADFKCKKCLNIIRKYSFDDSLWGEKEHQGYTPLFIALIRWPYSSFTRYLLLFLLNKSSTSLHIQDNHGKTILHWAIFNHYLVKLIIENRWVNLSHTKDKFGKTPFDYADDQQLGKSIEYLRI